MYKFITSILSFTPTNCGSPPPPRRYGTPSPPAPPSLLGTPSPPAPPSHTSEDMWIGLPPPPWPAPSCILTVNEELVIATGIFTTACEPEECLICRDGTILELSSGCAGKFIMNGDTILIYGTYDGKYMTKCIPYIL